MIRKIFLCLPVLFLSCSHSAPDRPAAGEDQESVILIRGAVEAEHMLNLEQLQQLDDQQIGTVQLKKGSGEIYKVLENATGVLLRDVLLSVDIAGQNNKNYSAFFVVCTAADGYQSLYSWNEIFNTDIGEHIYLITDFDTGTSGQSPSSIMMVSLEDHINGKRNLRGLVTIDILDFSKLK